MIERLIFPNMKYTRRNYHPKIWFRQFPTDWVIGRSGDLAESQPGHTYLISTAELWYMEITFNALPLRPRLIQWSVIAPMVYKLKPTNYLTLWHENAFCITCFCKESPPVIRGFLHKVQWRETLMLLSWTSCWTNYRVFCSFRPHYAHMISNSIKSSIPSQWDGIWSVCRCMGTGVRVELLNVKPMINGQRKCFRFVKITRKISSHHYCFYKQLFLQNHNLSIGNVIELHIKKPRLMWWRLSIDCRWMHAVSCACDFICNICKMEIMARCSNLTLVSKRFPRLGSEFQPFVFFTIAELRLCIPVVHHVHIWPISPKRCCNDIREKRNVIQGT